MDFSFFELLQLNDATFPIGSYTFSWGLETFVQQGIIHDSKSAEAFIGSELSGSFLYSIERRRCSKNRGAVWHISEENHQYS